MLTSESVEARLDGANAAPADSLRRALLLFVDDQIDSLEILKSIFHDDHEVSAVSGGAAALAYCTEHLPDLILLGVDMPDMDGHALCRCLKADPRTQDIPLMFLTGRADPADEARALVSGAVDYIAKPLNVDVLRARVHSHLAQRRATLEIRERNDTLERRAHERGVLLESALGDLHISQNDLARSEAQATLTTVIASVSHELGAPIGNSVMVASTLTDMVRSLKGVIDEGGLKRSTLNKFMDELQTISALLLRNMARADDLLCQFRQVAADQASERRRLFDLANSVQEVLATIMPSLKRFSHRVRLEIPDGIVMDSLPGPLGQIVINLVNNAFTHAFLASDGGELHISAVADGEHVRLCFADNGVGIPAENMTAIFTPFFSTRIGQGGTGLGMTIVDNLARCSLGGTLQVESTVGLGTTVIITLPLVLPVNADA